MEMEMDIGLMPQIQALIAPPPSEVPTRMKRKDPHDKRKGKGQNRDTCDACGECGSLICCEKCPTALHLQCQDPPLDEDDVPLGEWLCRVCKAKSTKSKDKKCLETTENMDPLEILIKATEQQNPYRYTISKRYKPVMSFPGADKNPKKVVGRRGSAKKAAPDQMKFCFACNRGPRAGQLLNCDYCSLSYHLDCLDPPMTIPPLGTWMCPNHAEQFLDANILQSASVIERAKLWALVAKDIDHDALKIEFIRKVSRKNPPFRYKIKKPERARSAIPPAVDQMYQNPIPLVPSLPENMKIDLNRKVNETPTSDEINEWLSSLFAMQASCAWDMCLKNSTDPRASNEEATNSPKNPEMVEEMMEKMFSSKKKLNRAAIDNFVAQLENGGTNTTLEAHVLKMDQRLLQVLAIQRLQQILPQYKGKNNVPTTHVPNVHDIKVKIKEECPPNEVYAMFDENAFLKNGVICPKKAYVALKDLNGGLKLEDWKEQERNSRADEELEEGEVTATSMARAALAPVGSLLRIAPVPMRLKTLTIGTSPDCDVCLTDFGLCQFTSAKHAKIFYDTMTGEYELLNYSPHGTVIDGCLYSLDATQWRVPSAPVVSDPLTLNVRAILDKRRGIKREAETAANIRVARPAARRVCDCVERLTDATGWEGSALLQHCSHLQFGCLQFVFSIVDFAPSKIVTPDDEDKKKRRTDENGQILNAKGSSVEMKE